MSSSGSGLSDEQRRRMEENRLKAIERRNAAIARNNAQLGIQNQGLPRPATVKPQMVPAPSISPLSLGSRQITGNYQNQNQTSNPPTRPPSSAYPSSSSASNNNFYKPATGTSGAGGSRFPPPKIQPNSFSSSTSTHRGNVVSGTCTMISRERFLVEMSYQSEAIAIFKSISGCAYGEFGMKKLLMWKYLTNNCA